MPKSSPKANEIELKFLIGKKDDFQKLFNHFLKDSKTEDIKKEEQRNFIFDTNEHALHESHFLLRLRESNGKYKLSVKATLDDSDENAHLSSRIEHEIKVSDEEAKEMLMNPMHVMEYFCLGSLEKDKTREKRRLFLCKALETILHDQKLHLLGSFTNTRHSVSLKEGSKTYVVEMDETSFQGQIHHEVELEVDQPEDVLKASKMLTDLFKALQIAFDTSKTKSARFYDLLRRP